MPLQGIGVRAQKDIHFTPNANAEYKQQWIFLFINLNELENVINE